MRIYHNQSNQTENLIKNSSSDKYINHSFIYLLLSSLSSETPNVTKPS